MKVTCFSLKFMRQIVLVSSSIDFKECPGNLIDKRTIVNISSNNL